MKIGILQCDSVLPQYQSRFGDYPQMLEALFMRSGFNPQLRVYDVTQQIYPAHLDECDAYITTGSKASVYDDLAWIRRLEDFIRELHARRKPLIGICFGHQLVAQALGGKTARSERGWGVGVHTSNVLVHKSWQIPERKKLSLLVSHQDQVVQIPTGAEVIAGSEFCPYAMLQIGTHILTFQSHPEFVKEYSKTMMEHRAERLGKDVLEKGIASLDQVVDDQIAAQWIWRFLTKPY